MTRARDNSFNPFNNQVAGKNFVINGGMDIWQRGTTFSNPTNLSYTADRWFSFWGSSNRTVSRQAGFGGNNYSIRVGRNSGVSDTSFSGIGTIIESANMYLLQGKTVTLSFYARVGANFSGNVFATVIQSATGIDQGANAWWAGSWTSRVNNAEYYINPTTTATRYSTTFTIPSNATELIIYHQYQASGTAGAADYFEITGIQLELGSVPTEFSRTGGAFGTELNLCRRYYFEGFVSMISQGTNGIHGFLLADSMRSTPSVTFEYDNINNRVYRMDNAARFDLVSPTVIATSNALTTMYAFTPAGWSGSAGIGFNAYWRFNSEL